MTTSLPDVVKGGLHVVAHNDERHAINELLDLVNNGRLSAAGFPETVQDLVGAMIQAGSGVTVSYNDTAGTFTISSPLGTTEAIQDLVGAMVQAGSGTSVAYDDNAGTLTVTAASATSEAIQDIVGAMVVAGSGTSVSYDDNAGTLTITAASATSEAIQDIVGAMVVGGAGVTATYDDPSGTLTVALANITETVQDIMGATLVAGANTSITYDDAAGTITITSAGGGGGAGTGTVTAVNTKAPDGTGNVTLVKGDIGLGNVANVDVTNHLVPAGGTAYQLLWMNSNTPGDFGWVTLNVDADPAAASLRTLGTGAQQAASGADSRIVNAIQTSSKNVASGVAGLDANGKLASSVLPTTDGVSEGTTNLYFTPARADARITAAVGVTVQGYSASLSSWAAKSVPVGDVVGSTDTVTLTNKTLTSPRINEFLDTNGLKVMTFNPVTSAVNYLRLDNAAAGGSPTLVPVGTDTNIGLNVVTKGTGKLLVNSNAVQTAADKNVASGIAGLDANSRVSMGNLYTNVNAGVPTLDVNARLQEAALPLRLRAAGFDNTISNANNATASGVYWLQQNSTNGPGPAANDYMLHVAAYGTTYVNQIAVSTHDNSIMWMRVCDGGTWGAWRAVGGGGSGAGTVLGYSNPNTSTGSQTLTLNNYVPPSITITAATTVAKVRMTGLVRFSTGVKYAYFTIGLGSSSGPNAYLTQSGSNTGSASDAAPMYRPFALEVVITGLTVGIQYTLSIIGTADTNTVANNIFLNNVGVVVEAG